MSSPAPQSSPQTHSKTAIKHLVTFRAIALGTICVAFMAWGGHFTRHIGHTTKMAQDHLPWGVVVPFFVIAVIVNKLLEKFRPKSILTSSELLVIFSMAWNAWAVPLFWRLSLVFGIACFCYITVAILRKQWTEHERLSFALMSLPFVSTNIH